MRLNVFLGFAWLFLAVQAQAAVDFIHVKTEADYQRAISLAKEKNLMIFADVYAVWCGPCKMMDKNVFTQAEVENYLTENFISIKVDAEKGYGATIAQDFSVAAYPTFLVIDSEGNQVGSFRGYREADDFTQELGNILAMDDEMPALLEKFKTKTLEKEGLQRLTELLISIENEEKAKEVADVLFGELSEKEKLEHKNMELFMATEPFLLANDRTQFYTKNAKKIHELHGFDGIEQLFGVIYDAEMTSAIEEKSEKRVTKLLLAAEDIYLKYTEEANADEMGRMSWTIFYGYTENWKGYEKAVIKYEDKKDKEYFINAAAAVLDSHGANEDARKTARALLAKADEKDYGFSGNLILCYSYVLDSNAFEAEKALALVEKYASTDREKEVVKSLQEKLSSFED